MSLWVFGYGSLLWKPEFTPEESAVARLDGWHRSFCMSSIHYRGTPEVPGLVLALDAAPGASCTGLALRAAPRDEAMVLDMLRKRELISDAYVEMRLPLTLSDGREVEALTYVINRQTAQYVHLDLEEQARKIARASGPMGSNADYLLNTASHLQGLGLADPDLDWLSRRVQTLMHESDS
ncbi:gamma-glutamylcyclotransferase [Pseudoroseicyclus aestuarii]|uniref:glutathione-specific gamma-glutamylcyclotransferase n=1 Tax=Pseudoroseicyclus aestuarii TaxID=1795041 RepID=A0A318SSX5_9RHOB|nr:gamma-glutamylcyclotransferase [Pseudoroseicyclus aestuarii]PYE82402.1 cation transport protein ChaC [Pseudoroseicyclus aestuarii]